MYGFVFFNDTATTEIYTLSLHDALPIFVRLQREMFVVGAELATAPENRSKLAPGVSLVTPEMVEALEPLIDDITARYDPPDRKSTRLNSSHANISYAVFCLKKKNIYLS